MYNGHCLCGCVHKPWSGLDTSQQDDSSSVNSSHHACGFFTNRQNCQFWHQRLYTWKKIQWQNVTPSGNRTWTSHSLWLQVQHYPFYTNLTFACKTETLGSLYSHALLISLKSSKSKYQVVHEQQFKDVLSSTCQVSVERIVLDLESEVIRGPNLWENRCVSLFLEINLCH